VKLKNYSTSIDAKKTVGEIEQLLAQMGATRVMKEFYGDGRIKALAFELMVEGKPHSIKLPAEVDKAQAILSKQKGFPQRNQIEANQRAERVVWRIIKDWLYSQFSLFEIGQAKPQQIFLPYFYDGRETFYERIEKGGFGALQLEAKSDNVEIPKRKIEKYEDAVYEEVKDL
jgi:hypothetical protein